MLMHVSPPPPLPQPEPVEPDIPGAAPLPADAPPVGSATDLPPAGLDPTTTVLPEPPLPMPPLDAAVTHAD